MLSSLFVCLGQFLVIASVLLNNMLKPYAAGLYRFDSALKVVILRLADYMNLPPAVYALEV
jgi:hypothetical protein